MRGIETKYRGENGETNPGVIDSTYNQFQGLKEAFFPDSNRHLNQDGCILSRIEVYVEAL